MLPRVTVGLPCPAGAHVLSGSRGGPDGAAVTHRRCANGFRGSSSKTSTRLARVVDGDERGEGWFDGYAATATISFELGHLAGAWPTLRRRPADSLNECRLACDALGAGRRVPASTPMPARPPRGAWSSPVGARPGADIPVRARKRDVFAFEADVDLRDAPLPTTPSGVWFRPEVQRRGRFLCGSPPRDGVSYDVAAISASGGSRSVRGVHLAATGRGRAAFDPMSRPAGAEDYEMKNTFDDYNGLVGVVTPYHNVFTACGFSGHGLQQAPAVGRGLAELIATCAHPVPLDLVLLRLDRVAEGEPLLWAEHH